MASSKIKEISVIIVLGNVRIVPDKIKGRRITNKTIRKAYKSYLKKEYWI